MLLYPLGVVLIDGFLFSEAGGRHPRPQILRLTRFISPGLARIRSRLMGEVGRGGRRGDALVRGVMRAIRAKSRKRPRHRMTTGPGRDVLVEFLGF